MKILHYFLIGLCFSYSARADFYGYHEYASPDKKYVAQFNRSDREVVLVIKNRLSKKKEFFTTTLIPAVKYVQWSPDSASLLIVAHISGGSQATIIHHNNNEWVSYDCDPPIHTPCCCFLVGVKFLEGTARLTCGVYPKKGSPISDQKICIFNLNYQTGLITLKKFEPLTKKDFEKLNTKTKRKWMMWENGTVEKEISLEY